MSQNDPTDHALAAIASILDPESRREPEKAATEERPVGSIQPVSSIQIEADGYSRVGPGPMDAIRFKWAVRREGHDRYFVDETIGYRSRPITSGPMSADAAIKFVDDRETEARQRFEHLKSEMSGHPAAASVVHSGEM